MKSITLKDGTTVTLRPIRPQDEPDLTSLYARLSPESAYQRFFTVMARLPPNWTRILANVNYDRRMAIVAVGSPDELIAVACYDYDDAAQEAEIAIVVQGRWQERGLGTSLMAELLSYVEAKGIRRFWAYVLAENRRMLDVLRRLGQVLERNTEDGVTSILLAPRPRTETEGS